MKVVYNSCHGGFTLSAKACEWLIARRWRFSELLEKAFRDSARCSESIPRHDHLLVECVETLGSLANGESSKLSIATVASAYEITSYDGKETVHEKYVNGYTDEDIAHIVANAVAVARKETTIAVRMETALAISKECVKIADGLASDYEARAKLPHAKGTPLWGTRMTQASVASEVSDLIKSCMNQTTLSNEAIEALIKEHGGSRMEEQKPDKQEKAETVSLPLVRCAAGMDGECVHRQCPQTRDGEPRKSKRTCPLPWRMDDEMP